MPVLLGLVLCDVGNENGDVQVNWGAAAEEPGGNSYNGIRI